METNTRVTVRCGISGRASTPDGVPSSTTTGTSVTTTFGSRSSPAFSWTSFRFRSRYVEQAFLDLLGHEHGDEVRRARGRCASDSVRIAPSRSSPRHASGSRSGPPPANARQRSWSSGGTAPPGDRVDGVDLHRAERPQVPERLRGRRIQVADEQHHVVRAQIPRADGVASELRHGRRVVTVDRQERGDDDRDRPRTRSTRRP